ncbi:bifunctional phosphopantothenoylcysteine decarboxylase/phosphopantothenate--cysteine ligase CoaBC [Aetokthonos hydrillicola Thurmond2011]|jgi:phosphopantothenoylcysteine decarboxylase/phosphopantothenate--cysteine ligase|uniref:Coenzyme A biosynthesis bifunctional protein CoaBC n=1 Tax=Aetokthonos hydrillicola Thurmond2011 TaxID=2712845 RepID=A0AAP5I937_9CYAN|nr:bifunctional phosphopantothenoylcysteine decarboxylase/phosphopantothenate--cysteine ligase CoaBC [Aetokthonos hydrillicola]MBO3459473.1 bifunctional phosphopantothenoylcysteine decarboxylase/phosphopantothenate--cysteine ligase CoaBC [Aetokthonos hydrillicola CCALA 1050]MBW4583836.1 bifunctional phosphopantothenoylcysteine decarboxylase/phosphopantothenate--cysteine ligase CoaBC [Aetokthonos hydrillicola CCALA 1050]MDR9895468.1 bifunctional phosphopantothenoylcysteine decarboxylase/phosphopa
MKNAKSRRVLVGVSGGIAAYKVCEVVSTLFKAGVEVRVILTSKAQEFITPLTLATLSRHPAYTDENFWESTHSRPLHIDLGEWADVFVIAPLSANTLAKLAYGMADNLLTNTVLASKSPILLVPAMNTDMWEQMSVQRNWQQLLTDSRYHAMNTASGLLACDRVGSGRMAEPPEIVAYTQSLLQTFGKRDLAGKRVLISAGGTREHLDPVRFIGNPSTGKMGLATALAALHRGANVTLVHAPANWDVPLGIQAIPVVSADQMRASMLEYLLNADVIVMSAAVADVKPREYSYQKLPKRSLPETLPLEFVPDIIAELATCKQPHQKLIGFAAQTGDIIKPALEKLYNKNLDVIVANPIDEPGSGFGSDNNRAVFLDKQGTKLEIASCSKLEMAHHLFDFVVPTLGMGMHSEIQSTTNI